MTIKGRLGALPEEDRPREKLLSKGPAALTNEELVAILLGTGSAGRGVLETAQELLRRDGLTGLVRRGPEDLLRNRQGIGAAKAARLAAVLEVARRVLAEPLAERDLVCDPETAAQYLLASLAKESREVMGALLLDAKNRLIRDYQAFAGTVSATSVAPAPIFREAVLAGAVSLVVYHNHPSGDPEPSPEDRATTERLVRAGREIGIPVRDHLVIGRGRWVSFHRRGLMPV